MNNEVSSFQSLMQWKTRVKSLNETLFSNFNFND